MIDRSLRKRSGWILIIYILYSFISSHLNYTFMPNECFLAKQVGKILCLLRPMMHVKFKFILLYQYIWMALAIYIHSAACVSTIQHKLFPAGCSATNDATVPDLLCWAHKLWTTRGKCYSFTIASFWGESNLIRPFSYAPNIYRQNPACISLRRDQVC